MFGKGVIGLAAIALGCNSSQIPQIALSASPRLDPSSYHLTVSLPLNADCSKPVIFVQGLDAKGKKIYLKVTEFTARCNEIASVFYHAAREENHPPIPVSGELIDEATFRRNMY